MTHKICSSLFWLLLSAGFTESTAKPQDLMRRESDTINEVGDLVEAPNTVAAKEHAEMSIGNSGLIEVRDHVQQLLDDVEQVPTLRSYRRCVRSCERLQGCTPGLNEDQPEGWEKDCCGWEGKEKDVRKCRDSYNIAGALAASQGVGKVKKEKGGKEKKGKGKLTQLSSEEVEQRVGKGGSPRKGKGKNMAIAAGRVGKCGSAFSDENSETCANVNNEWSDLEMEKWESDGLQLAEKQSSQELQPSFPYTCADGTRGVDPELDNPVIWLCPCLDELRDQCAGASNTQDCFHLLMCNHPKVCGDWKYAWCEDALVEQLGARASGKHYSMIEEGDKVNLSSVDESQQGKSFC